MERRRVLATGAAAVAVAGGGVAKFGDDLVSVFRGAHERPPPIDHPYRPPPFPPPVIVHGAAAASKVRDAMEGFARAASDAADTTPEAAREAAKSAACQVLYVVLTQDRLPSDQEWVQIGVDALADASINVPVGSPAWRQLEQVKAEAERAVTNLLGLPSDDDAQSLGDELACAWV